MTFYKDAVVRLRVDIGREGANRVATGTRGRVTKVANDTVHVLFDDGDAWQFAGTAAYECLEFA